MLLTIFSSVVVGFCVAFAASAAASSAEPVVLHAVMNSKLVIEINQKSLFINRSSLRNKSISLSSSFHDQAHPIAGKNLLMFLYPAKENLFL